MVYLELLFITRSTLKLFNLASDFRSIHNAYCDQLFSDGPLLEQLRATNFSVAIVDLMGSHCNLALAKHLGIPVIGFWNSVPFGTGEYI